MSVTFWCPDAPQQKVECNYCVEYPDFEPNEHGGTCSPWCTRTRMVSESPEINMSNSNAHNMLHALGLVDDDYLCGSLEVATAEPILMKAQATATLNRMSGSHYWAGRLEQFIGLVGYARKNNYKKITWG